jgi:hypothetical protein
VDKLTFTLPLEPADEEATVEVEARAAVVLTGALLATAWVDEATGTDPPDPAPGTH